MYILKRTTDGRFELIHALQAHSKQIYSVALNNSVSMIATVCFSEDKVTLWNVEQGVCMFFFVPQPSCCVDAHRHIAAGFFLRRPISHPLLQPQPQQTHRGM